MRKRTTCDLQPRLTDMRGAALYCGLGLNRTAELVREAGAAKKYGRRLLIDLRALDALIDELPSTEAE